MIISLSCGYQSVFIFPSFVFVIINFFFFCFLRTDTRWFRMAGTLSYWLRNCSSAPLCSYLMEISSSVKLKTTPSGLAQSINIQLLRISETFCNSSLLKEGWEILTNLLNFEYTKTSVQQSIIKDPGYWRFILLFAWFTIKTWMETCKWKVSGTPGMDWPPSFKNQFSLECYANLKNIRIIQIQV